MQALFGTSDVAADKRSHRWSQIISTTYFPLDLCYRDAPSFNGELAIWSLGSIGLSRLSSDALSYRRTRDHLFRGGDEHYLITIPVKSEVYFSQCGKEVTCKPGGFIVERSDEPYQFGYSHTNDLWVLKVKENVLKGHVLSPDRFCSLEFDASSSVGALLLDMIKLVPERYSQLDETARELVGQQLIDLLVLSLKKDGRVLNSNTSTVREAHLSRIESYIRAHITDPTLDPENIANGCGISLRYLHTLFRDTNQTVSQWLRTQRLELCRETLSGSSSHQTIAEIAYHWGFNDQAQFSRLFKGAFGVTPREFRNS
jgi:AraC-like DNA-binding protein